MLDSFLNDFSFIRDTFDKEGDHNLFGKNFSFFSAEPILFYNNEKDVIVYANSMFSDEFNYTIDDLKEWKYSFYPLLNKEDQEPFKTAMNALIKGDEHTPLPDSVYKLVGKGKKHSYYRVRVKKLHKSYYYIQLENAAKSAVPVLKNSTADQLMHEAEFILKFGFWMWDISTSKLYWTKGMYHLLEYDKEEDDLVVTPELYATHILKNEAYHRFEQGLMEGIFKDAYTIKYQLNTNKGNILTVSEHGKIDYDDGGKIRRVIGITRDITLQEESMKGLADYKAMMLENETFLNYGTWESDAEGDNMFWTEGMYNIFGYDEISKNSLTINRDLYEKHMDAEDYKNDRKINLHLLKDNDHYSWDYKIKDHNGAIKILSTYAKIIRNNESEIQKIIGTTRDVTELRRHEKNLEDTIIELNRSNRELEEFAYVASHDLQEPLRKISTFGQRLQLKFLDKLGEDGNLYIKRMILACDNMRKLIDNLLEFSRINLNNPAPGEVELNYIVNEVIEELDLIIVETNTTITLKQLPFIEAIGSQMLQLFANIFSNSIKFRKENIPLQIEVSSRELDLEEKTKYQLHTASTYFLISVKDNGVGFEQQYADKIFQLFQRLQGKSEYPGTGMGLSICKKIVTNHKGIIYAESEPGVGTSINIILPQQQ